MGEQLGFEQGDAVEAPGGIGELLDELGFRGTSGLVFVEEAAAMRVVRGNAACRNRCVVRWSVASWRGWWPRDPRELDGGT